MIYRGQRLPAFLICSHLINIRFCLRTAARFRYMIWRFGGFANLVGSPYYRKHEKALWVLSSLVVDLGTVGGCNMTPNLTLHRFQWLSQTNTSSKSVNTRWRDSWNSLICSRIIRSVAIWSLTGRYYCVSQLLEVFEISFELIGGISE